MTRDVLDRLLATSSSHRLADICDRAATSAPSDRTSPTLRCLAIQRGRPRPVSQTRRGGCFLWARWANGWSVGPGSPGHRPQESGGRESVSAAVGQPHSQAAVRAGWTGCNGVCRTWSEIGVLTGLRAGASRCPGRCNSGSSVRCSRCLAAKVKLIRDA
jgi:hypothetical protein